MDWRALSIVGLPFRVVLFGLLGALLIVGIGARPRLLHWAARLLAVVVAVGCVGAQINAHYAYFPTVGALLGRRAADQISAAGFQRLEARSVRSFGSHFRSYGRLAVSEPRDALPVRGVVVAWRFPATISHFAQRAGEVYLPPIWFENPHPHLPVIELLHGSPGSPADWTRGGFADVTADSYAALHGGFAPILVMPDVNGAHWWNDSECVNGVQGNAETYLTVDVRNAIVQAFAASPSGRDWAVAGLSEGGSCALQMALRHPKLFAAAGDFGGEDHPYVHGGPTHLFVGSTAAQLAAAEAAYDPRVLLAHWDNPLKPAITFGVGRSDSVRERDMRLYQRAQSDGFNTIFATYPGSHSFRVFSRCLAGSFAWMTELVSR
jgi:S-formylglutathione hydrolase FrmB